MKITNNQLDNIQTTLDRTEKYNDLVNMKNNTLLQLHNERKLYDEKMAVIQKLADDLEQEFEGIDIIEVILGKLNDKITCHGEYVNPQDIEDGEDIWSDVYDED
ncbi:MAG: hypothetical protein GY928_14160 [Colwellia sp.]|nr:hypothetical protein [Colwellia sp.]